MRAPCWEEKRKSIQKRSHMCKGRATMTNTRKIQESWSVEQKVLWCEVGWTRGKHPETSAFKYFVRAGRWRTGEGRSLLELTWSDWCFQGIHLFAKVSITEFSQGRSSIASGQILVKWGEWILECMKSRRKLIVNKRTDDIIKNILNINLLFISQFQE